MEGPRIKSQQASAHTSAEAAQSIAAAPEGRATRVSSIRNYLDLLEPSRELVRIRHSVDTHGELCAVMRRVQTQLKKAVLF